MPTLTLKGKKPGPPPKPTPPNPVVEIGYAVIRLIEVAREVGRLTQRISDQATWLERNPDHPRSTERENTRWHWVMRCNAAKGEERKMVWALTRAISAAGQDARHDANNAFHATFGPKTGITLSRIAELHHDATLIGVIDEWSRNEVEAGR